YFDVRSVEDRRRRRRRLVPAAERKLDRSTLADQTVEPSLEAEFPGVVDPALDPAECLFEPTGLPDALAEVDVCPARVGHQRAVRARELRTRRRLFKHTNRLPCALERLVDTADARQEVHPAPERRTLAQSVAVSPA